MNSYDPHLDHLPEDVREYGEQLDRLGAMDRRRASGLEDRIFAATREALPAASSIAVIGPGSAMRQQGVRRRVFTPMRLAAAVAISTAGVAMWVATMAAPGPAAPQPEMLASSGNADAELDYLVALAGLDEGWGPMNERLDVLKLETEAAAGSLLWDVAWGSILLTEGAM